LAAKREDSDNYPFTLPKSMVRPEEVFQPYSPRNRRVMTGRVSSYVNNRSVNELLVKTKKWTRTQGLLRHSQFFRRLLPYFLPIHSNKSTRPTLSKRCPSSCILAGRIHGKILAGMIHGKKLLAVIIDRK
jgi:hypothetical protein